MINVPVVSALMPAGGRSERRASPLWREVALWAVPREAAPPVRGAFFFFFSLCQNILTRPAGPGARADRRLRAGNGSVPPGARPRSGGTMGGRGPGQVTAARGAEGGGGRARTRSPAAGGRRGARPSPAQAAARGHEARTGGAAALSRELGERPPPLARPGPAAPPSARPHPHRRSGAAGAGERRGAAGRPPGT